MNNAFAIARFKILILTSLAGMFRKSQEIQYFFRPMILTLWLELYG